VIFKLFDIIICIYIFIYLLISVIRRHIGLIHLYTSFRVPTDERLCSTTIECADPLCADTELFCGTTEKCREYVHMGHYVARQKELRMRLDGQRFLSRHASGSYIRDTFL